MIFPFPIKQIAMPNFTDDLTCLSKFLWGFRTLGGCAKHWISAHYGTLWYKMLHLLPSEFPV